MMDPMEQIIAEALDQAGIRYVTDHGGGNPTNLDFGLESGIQIEVKQYHSARIADQMSRAPDVIAVQGRNAVMFMAHLLKNAHR